MSKHHLNVNLIPEITLQPSTPTSPLPERMSTDNGEQLSFNMNNLQTDNRSSMANNALKAYNHTNFLDIKCSPKTAVDSKNINPKDKRTLKPLLMHLVRMGSFQSPHLRLPSTKSPAIEDSFDFLNLNSIETAEDLMEYCLRQCKIVSKCEPLSQRNYITVGNKAYDDNDNQITIMQWNILSQAIGYTCDRFDTCAEKDLQWSSRKWKIIYEIAQYMPFDVICLQEVDHYDFMERMLIKVGYRGTFTPKPDSPCYYISGNTGPDGCAIFYNSSRVTLLKSSSRILQVFDCESNQVVLNCKFKCKRSGKIFCVSTTHLKARKGPILAFLRDEQGKDILDFLDTECGHVPTIITGDFNADPTEPVYQTMTHKYNSAYKTALDEEPPLTNWTKRVGEAEIKQTIDYVFYDEKKFKVNSVLNLESPRITSPIPSSLYPSDHMSLIAKFSFKK